MYIYIYIYTQCLLHLMRGRAAHREGSGGGSAFTNIRTRAQKGPSTQAMAKCSSSSSSNSNSSSSSSSNSSSSSSCCCCCSSSIISSEGAHGCMAWSDSFQTGSGQTLYYTRLD